MDLGCGTGEFLHNYHELGSICTGVDIYNNFKFNNKKDFKLINTNINNFFKINKNKYDIIFLFEFIEHLNLEEKEILFKKISKILNSNGLIFILKLDKNLISKFFSIDIAENLLNLLPKKLMIQNYFLHPPNYINLQKKMAFKYMI